MKSKKGKKMPKIEVNKEMSPCINCNNKAGYINKDGFPKCNECGAYICKPKVPSHNDNKTVLLIVPEHGLTIHWEVIKKYTSEKDAVGTWNEQYRIRPQSTLTKLGLSI